MFSLFGNKEAYNIERIFEASTLAISFAIQEHLRTNSNHLKLSSDQQNMTVAAMTNYLVGHATQAMHEKNLNMADIINRSLTWAASSKEFRELIVQSLRTANANDRNKISLLSQHHFAFKRYAAEFPASLDSTGYEKVLRNAIKLLPESGKDYIDLYLTTKLKK